MKAWCQTGIARVINKTVDRFETRMRQRRAAAVNGGDATIVLTAAFLRAFGVRMVMLVAMVIIFGHRSMITVVGQRVIRSHLRDFGRGFRMHRCIHGRQAVSGQ